MAFFDVSLDKLRQFQARSVRARWIGVNLRLNLETAVDRFVLFATS
jgi:hypothetical protein